MKLRYLIASTALLLLTAVGTMAAGRGIFEELGFPVYPGSRLVSETVLPEGPLLDQINDEFSRLLPVSSLRQVGVATYTFDSSDDAIDVVKTFEPAATKSGWKTLVVSADRAGNATSIMINDKVGMLIINVDAAGRRSRQITAVRAMGSVNTSNIGNSSRISDNLGPVINSLRPGIPVGQPISVPPSEKLNIQSTKSNVAAQISGQNTAEIDLSAEVAQTGDLTRTRDGRLLLSLSSRLPIDSIRIPSNVPVLLELTGGSLNLAGGPGASGRPTRLNIISTGAPVTIESLPLVSGQHSIKVVGKPVQIDLSQTQGGTLDVEVQGGNLDLSLPQNASVTVSASSVSGKVINQTGLEAPNATDSNLNLQINSGKAEINLKAINGNITIRWRQ